MAERTNSEERLRYALKIAGIGIWEWDMISDQVLWDERQFELFGRDKVEGTIPLSYANDVIHPDDREKLNKSALKVLNEGAIAAEEFRVIHPDGSVRWLLGCSGVVQLNLNEDSARLIGVNTDITEKKKAEVLLHDNERRLKNANEILERRIAKRTAELQDNERRLKETNAILESRITKRTAELEEEAEKHKKTLAKLGVAQRLESIGLLAGGVAHDFNNLLTIIGGNLELAMLHTNLEEVTQLMLEAQKAVESGISLNQRLLLFARKRELKPTRLSFGDQMLATIRLLERTLGDDIPIETKIPPNLWDAFVDSGELDSALINIALNARQAMPAGGNLLIECCNYVLADEDAHLNPDTRPSDYVGLYVTDTGEGMTPEVLQKSIDPFFTTKEQGEGVGLGLSSVYGLVKQSDGFMNIDSTDGKGTTVRMYLPRARKEFGRFPASNPPEQPPKSKGETILVVDDDVSVRKIVVRNLQYLEYQVVEASCGQEAIDLLKNDLSVELLFTDIIMPGGVTGYDLAEWVTAYRPDIKVLMTSGYNDTKQTNNQRTVLGKPYSLHQLACGIRNALEC